MKISPQALVAVLLFSAAASAEDLSKLSEADKKKLVAKAAELAVPGPEHKLLAEMAGPFTLDIKIWPQPGAQPMAMKATGTGKMIIGGRFLQSESSGGAGPMAMESMMLLGFDRRHGVYTIHGCDSWGTYCVDARGKYDDKAKAVVMSGEDVDPTFGATQIYDFVLRRVSADETIIEIIFKDTNHGNKEPFKMVEMTRRKTK